MATVVGQATNGNRVNREHLRESLAPLATKADLYRSLGVWGITITAINVGATVSLIKFLP